MSEYQEDCQCLHPESDPYMVNLLVCLHHHRADPTLEMSVRTDVPRHMAQHSEGIDYDQDYFNYY